MIKRRIMDFVEAAGTLGLLILYACLGIALLKWLPRIADGLYPLAAGLSKLLLAVQLLILLPMAAFRRMREVAGAAIHLSSYSHGAALFLFSVLTAYRVWGYGGLIFGFMLAGIGVVPVALLAALTHGLWFQLSDILIFTLLIFGSRLLGARLAASAPAAAPYPGEQAHLFDSR
jgi:hypothetical protein